MTVSPTAIVALVGGDPTGQHVLAHHVAHRAWPFGETVILLALSLSIHIEAPAR